ncbi:glycerol-3-phosphate responsive antiterminator [Gudongella sp. DL1XJH-153]|uniref:glycerol-3-phosphate responsive antiterminator n=1 Tax=Gudongella sp. DL1XJH-153 TaxID=3409804 RepID=UPI003BB7F897
MNRLFDSLIQYPIIAEVNTLDEFNKALDSHCQNIFLMTGNVFNLRQLSNKAHNSGKNIYIYLDAIDGYSKDSWGLEFISKNIEIDGIITSKPVLMEQSKEMGIFTLGRFSIYNEYKLDYTIDKIKQTRPHCAIILPGVLPKLIEKVARETKTPVISSGFLDSRETIIESLESGAIGITTVHFLNPEIY